MKKKMSIIIKKEDIRFKPRLKLKATIKHKDKKRYDRKKENKKSDPEE